VGSRVAHRDTGRRDSLTSEIDAAKEEQPETYVRYQRDAGKRKRPRREPAVQPVIGIKSFDANAIALTVPLDIGVDLPRNWEPARYGEVFGTQEQSARWEVSQGTTISKTSIHTMPAAAERQLFDYPSASMAQPAVPMLRWTEAPAESIRNHFS
jgi:hypothetical protein